MNFEPSDIETTPATRKPGHYAFDVAILGAGTAGMSAFREASNHAGRIALIDGGPILLDHVLAVFDDDTFPLRRTLLVRRLIVKKHPSQSGINALSHKPAHGRNASMAGISVHDEWDGYCSTHVSSSLDLLGH